MKENTYIYGNVYAKSCFFSSSGTCVVAFANAGAWMSRAEAERAADPWGLSFFRKQKINALCFASLDTANWYLDHDFLSHLPDVCSVLSGFSDKVGYGGSMGGTAIVGLGKLLTINRALLINPICSLDSRHMPNETRYKEGRALPWNTAPHFQPSQAPEAGVVVYDPFFAPDSRQAALLPVNYKKLYFYGVGHYIPEWLHSVGYLKPLVLDYVRSGTVDLKSFYQHTRKRKCLRRHYKFMLGPDNQHLNRKRWATIANYYLRYRANNSVLPHLVLSDIILSASRHAKRAAL